MPIIPTTKTPNKNLNGGIENMKKTLGIALNIILYIFVYFASMFGSGLVLRIFTLPNPEFKSWVLNNQGILMAVTSLIAFIILSLIFMLKKKSLIAYCGFKGFSLKSLPLVVLTGIALGVFSICAVKTPFIANMCPALNETLKSITEGELVLIAILGPVILGSFIEEVLFRGALLNELAKGFKKVTAVILHGLLFTVIYGFMAGDLFVGAYAALGAVIFGLIYIWLDSIWAAIAAHVTSSMCLLILNRTNNPLSSGNGAAVVALISLLTLITALYFIKSISSNKAQNAGKSYTA